MVTSASNRKNINRNKRTVFELEALVTDNKANSYATRSTIEENRALIMKNYTAAFMGNRQLSNQNSDDILRNRKLVLGSVAANSDVAANYVESMINESTIEFIEHRADLNSAVLEVNKMMVEVNAMLIEINRTIMASNEKIVGFNKKQLDKNAQLLSAMEKRGGKLDASKATPKSNATRIKNNKARAAGIAKIAKSNTGKISALHKSAAANRKAIEKNSELVLKRRALINSNKAKIQSNQNRVAKLISS